MSDAGFQAQDDISSQQNARGRAPSISLTAPHNTPTHSPAPPTDTLHVRSNSEGALSRPRTRTMHRVKFTLAEDSSDGDEDQGSRRRSLPAVEDALPQTPPTAYLHSPEIRVEEPAEASGGPLGYFDLPSAISTPVSSNASVNSRMNLLAEDEKARQGDAEEKGRAMHGAYERAQRLASVIRRPSQQIRRSNLSQKISGWRRRNDGSPPPPISEEEAVYDNLDKLEKQAYESDEEGDNGRSMNPAFRGEAAEILRSMTQRESHPLTRVPARADDLPSGQVTPYEDRDPHTYVARPSQYRGGVLSSLLRMYNGRDEEQSHHHHHHRQQEMEFPSVQPPSRALSPSGKGGARPHRQKWYNNKHATQSSISLSTSPRDGSRRPSLGEKRKSSSAGIYTLAKNKFNSKLRLEEEIRLTVHIAETLARQKYLVKLCRALMRYGAPTHRLEEYMRMTARVLEIDGHFLYIPGCMIMAFDDNSTHTTEVKMIKSPQAVDLGRLRDIQVIYKEVVHDIIGVEEAMQRLDEIMNAKPKFRVHWIILLYGFASAMVGPFAFGARPIDLPIGFVLGCILAVLQHVIAPRSEHYANVFEISAAVITSFLARAFGSIKLSNGQHLFCFAALAQSSICLILPGYIVLCGALELQSRNIVAGSVRMVYAIIYSLFLGFGIMVGTAVYGLLDKSATSDFACPASPIENDYLQRFPFVIGFSICLCLINQAKFKQIPIMVTIAFTGYTVSFFSARRFVSTQISSAVGAFAIGIMGNLYSRLRHGLAAAAILPAIFLQVPSGLASSGSLVSSLIVAANIQGNSNSTMPLGDMANDWAASASAAALGDMGDTMKHVMVNRFVGNVVFDIGYGMLEVAVGITVGLFMAALVVYPFGKRRSGLFSF
ncbi:hypothetical protein AJ79_00429 [Helicocarpus griseus UAMH5409]|uniref:Threonine/serine exporter-like N-terminal domain-containing protein n=1 Tax=Helicocarpus griseus UAMH5409 TaxID=1447875 RepID=A0A2B7YBF7_9EURO|nr:hypothetical protein AJ79_00429 [Helicocarpus griseus UAMH5409]